MKYSFVKAESTNLPRINTFIHGGEIFCVQSNPDFCSAELRNVKTAMALALSCAVLSISLPVNLQPTYCTEDAQCSSGFYCEETTQSCVKCLRCEDLNREARLLTSVCVKSVTECGVCLKGLVEDLRLDHACVSLSQRSDSGGGSQLPTYAWISIGLLFIAFLFTIGYVLWRNDSWTYILGVRTSACASVRQHVGNGNGAAPSAPESPPPYNFTYEPVRPQSPSDTAAQLAGEETAAPFIKRAGQGPALGPRESAGNQAARPFHNPHYVRGPAAGFGHQVEESDPASPFSPHDEDTMESFWTPNEHTNNYNGNISENATDGVASPGSAAVEPAESAGGRGAGALARRAPAPADLGPPAKTSRLREDTNNNRGREAGGGSGRASPRAASPAHAHAHSLVINVVTNINNLEQRNSVNMPKH